LTRKEGETLEIRQRKGKEQLLRKRELVFFIRIKQNILLEIVDDCYKNKN